MIASKEKMEPSRLADNLVDFPELQVANHEEQALAAAAVGPSLAQVVLLLGVVVGNTTNCVACQAA